MHTNSARHVLVLASSDADCLVEELSAIARFEMTDTMVVDPSFAPAPHHSDILFAVEKPMVPFVLGEALFEHFPHDDTL